MGQVTGWADVDGHGNHHAFLYSDGQMRDLGTLGGAQSEGRAINDAGQVTGWAWTADDGEHAFLYHDGQMQDLATFPNGPSNGLGINNEGQVVGMLAAHAFLYTDGQMLDLNTLISLNRGMTLTAATAINDRGQIVVTDGNHAYLLTPVPIHDEDYTVTNAFSGLVLDDPDSSPDSGKQIIQSPATGNKNQKWHFAQQPDGFYTIQNVASGLFLTYPGAADWEQRVQLQQQTATNDASQLWMVNPVGTSSYVIYNKAGDLVINDPEFSQQPGQGMVLSHVNGGTNQRWFIR